MTQKENTQPENFSRELTESYRGLIAITTIHGTVTATICLLLIAILTDLHPPTQYVLRKTGRNTRIVYIL